MPSRKLLPALGLFLLAAPVLSFAGETPSGGTPCPAPTMTPPRAPEMEQAALASGTGTVPTNGRLRTRSYVGPSETVVIALLENGAAVPFDRKVEGKFIELVPQRPLKGNALVTVEVGGIRSGKYRVTPKDDVAPEIGAVRLESVVRRFVSGIVCPPPGPPADRIVGVAKIHEASYMRLRGRIMSGETVIATDESAYPTPDLVSRGPSDDRPFTFWFDAGTLKAGTHGVLRLDAVDVAGNVSRSLDVAFDVPPEALEPDAGGSTAAPVPAQRGCR